VVVDDGIVYSFPIVQTLGEGRSSIVYECWSELFKINVCVKCEPFDDSIQLVNEFKILQVIETFN
jgi:hypothetical protein